MVIHVTIFFTYPYSDIITIMLNRNHRKFFLPVAEESHISSEKKIKR